MKTPYVEPILILLEGTSEGSSIWHPIFELRVPLLYNTKYYNSNTGGYPAYIGKYTDNRYFDIVPKVNYTKVIDKGEVLVFYQKNKIKPYLYRVLFYIVIDRAYQKEQYTKEEDKPLTERIDYIHDPWYDITHKQK